MKAPPMTRILFATVALLFVAFAAPNAHADEVEVTMYKPQMLVYANYREDLKNLLLDSVNRVCVRAARPYRSLRVRRISINQCRADNIISLQRQIAADL